MKDNHKFSTKEETIEKVLIKELESIGNHAELIIHNDDFNTFDWVIESLMDVCDHTEVAAEQLALLIHFKGKATAKTAPVSIIKPMKDELVDRGLSAVIETTEG